MASSTEIYCYDGINSFNVTKWKIKVGSLLFYNSTILSYKQEGGTNAGLKEPLLKYKSNIGGTVTELLVSEGDIVKTGAPLLKVQPCTHPVIMKDLCAECGTDLRHLDREKFEKLTSATTFSMVHIVPELKVSLEQAEKLGRDDEDRLLKNKRLVLLVDLDQTLIHTTNDNVPQDMPEVFHFQLYGNHSPWYHTRLRPGTNNFLENISKYYELHICTFGARLYAHKIAKILDPDGKFFSHRILSRDECFDASSKTANLKALFPRGDHMVCIIDDREDVWNFAPNVIHVKPYTFFQNTGDINAPASSGAKNEDKPTQPNSNSQTAANEQNTSTPNTKENNAEKLTSAGEQGTVPGIQEKVNSEDMAKGNVQSTTCDKSKTENNEQVSSVQADTAVKETIISASNIPEVTQPQVSSEPKIEVNAAAPEPGKSEKTDVIVSNNGTSNESEVKTEGKEPDTPSLDDTHTDDYLLYLEEILINVHKAYYDLHTKIKNKGSKSIPDLKKVVPHVKQKVLKRVNIVFSSVIPTNCVPESHHLWTLAESLGASVSRELVLDSSKQKTTHVVATKTGTAKVNTAKRQPKRIWVVTLDWLLCCAERWEHADERLFKLSKDLLADGENAESSPWTQRGCKRPLSTGKKHHAKTEEEMFSERVFAEAGLALSQDDIADMDKEIEEACSEESEGEAQVGSGSSASDSSSSNESLSSGDYPKGWKRRRKCSPIPEVDVKESVVDDSSDAETIGSVDEEMAEAVKQEFQSF